MYLSLLLTHDDAENDLESVIFLPPPSECWDYSCFSLCLVYTMLRIKPQSFLYPRQALYQLRYPQPTFWMFLETVSLIVTSIVCPGSHYTTKTDLKFMLPEPSAPLTDEITDVSHHAWLRVDIFKDFFYEYVYMSACMSVHHAYAWFSWVS